jgi:hypothetical protein
MDTKELERLQRGAELNRQIAAIGREILFIDDLLIKNRKKPVDVQLSIAYTEKKDGRPQFMQVDNKVLRNALFAYKKKLKIKKADIQMQFDCTMMRARNKITDTMLERRNKVLVRISELTGIPSGTIMGGRRFHEIVVARAILAWVLTDLCGYTTIQAGILLRKHYSSVIYLRKKLNTAIRLPMDIVAIMEDLKIYNQQLNQQQNEQQKD